MSDYLIVEPGEFEAQEHPWDKIRAMPTSLSAEAQRMGGGSPIHESLLRSWHIMHEVTAMLDRGDSPRTIRWFIRWAEARHVGDYEEVLARAEQYAPRTR